MVDQAINAILNGNYIGKDTLVAQMDFSDNNHQAKVYFTNIGLKDKKICYQDVKPILDVYQIDYNKNSKEDL